MEMLLIVGDTEITTVPLTKHLAPQVDLRKGQAKEAAKQRKMLEWQQSWEEQLAAKWTVRLITQLTEWGSPGT